MAWCLGPGTRVLPDAVRDVIRSALPGPADQTWDPPGWLLPHQRPAAQRLAARLEIFGGALLADAVGLGKTYVALALASRAERPVATVPAALLAQWERTARRARVPLALVTHEALSRGAALPRGDLVIADEAHRFRNPETRRYDALARGTLDARVLLLTATPLVNQAADVIHLLRLFLVDHALALYGVPSLERAAAGNRHDELAHALSVVAVARTPLAARVEERVPAVQDGATYDDACLPLPALRDLVRRIDNLAFPTLGEPNAAQLLRLHLLSRLASSAPALAGTLRRHRNYLERAIAAARRGERIRRRVLMELLDDEDGAQLLLEFGAEVPEAVAPHPSALLAELERVQELRDLVRNHCTHGGAGDLKAGRLRDVLARRNGSKTIVFTTAVATARHLARLLAWQRIVVVTGHGAQIASGPLALAEALELFAPSGQGARAPARAAVADVLVATDLASEGLNLQDANAVVHYDLPWSPLRLTQRLGRIARLGSLHRAVDVVWFMPAPPLAERLAVSARLAVKARAQVAVGTPATSTVGQALLAGGLFDWREPCSRAGGFRVGAPCFAVVSGPRAALFVLAWQVGTRVVPEVLAMEGDPPEVVLEERRVQQLAQALMCAPVLRGAPPSLYMDTLRRVVRHRLASAQTGPRDAETRRLVRRIVRYARVAARKRSIGTLGALDQWLDALFGGLRVGALRELAAGLDHRGVPPAAAGAGASGCMPAVTLAAALFGDRPESPNRS
ncbi:MAG TPA: DEAD/DEAH box helicase [Gemmatimonadales bacterium]|nr:DEAD/DEAH box helicase [Gemmatimonadales bacterium]